MAQGEDVSAGGGVAGDGGDGRHRKGDEIGDDGAKEGVHLDLAIFVGFDLGPRKIVAVGEV